MSVLVLGHSRTLSRPPAPTRTLTDAARTALSGVVRGLGAVGDRRTLGRLAEDEAVLALTARAQVRLPALPSGVLVPLMAAAEVGLRCNCERRQRATRTRSDQLNGRRNISQKVRATERQRSHVMSLMNNRLESSYFHFIKDIKSCK